MSINGPIPYYIQPSYVQPYAQPVNVAYTQQVQQASYAVQNPYMTLPVGYNYPLNPQVSMPYLKLGNTKTPYGDDIHLYMLSNGQRVAIMPKEGTTVIKTFVNSGSMNETDEQRGISHFIEHNLFNGSKNLAPGQFFKDVSQMGASTNASTDFAQTDYYISSAFITDETLKKKVEMHADMILRPTFPEDMIEKEKGPVTSEISMVNDDVKSTAVNEVVRNLYQIQSNSKNLVAGSIKTVNALTREDLVDYWYRHYTPNNMYTVLVGDVNPDEAIDLIAKNFNQKPVNAYRTAEKLTPVNSPVRVDFKSQVDNSSAVIAGFSGPNIYSAKDKLTFEALGLLLTGTNTSRLSKELQKINGYAGFDSQKVGLNSQDPMALFMQVLTPKGREQGGIDTLYKAIEEVKVNPPTSEEMQTVKNTLNKLVAMSYESSETICNLIGSSLLDGDLHSLSYYQNIINSLTPQDLTTFAQKYLDLNKVSLGVIHASGTTDDEIAADFKRSPYSKRAVTVPNSTQISFGSSKPVTTGHVKELVLGDNSKAFISDSNSNLCYFNWRLTSHSSVPNNLATPYILATMLNQSISTPENEAFRKKAETLGIDFNIDTNGFSITAEANSLPETAPETVNMLKEAIFSPNFTEEEFEAAKQKVYDHFISANKDPSGGLVSQLYPEYFADIPKILAGIKSVRLQDVKSHWAHLVNNSSANFVATAPFGKYEGLENNLLNKVAIQGFKFKNQEVNLANVYQPTRNAQVIVDTEERNQAQIFKTYSFKMSGNIEDEVKFELLNTILGGSPSSRLFSDLREKEKLAYRVNSQVQSFGDTGIITMYILTTTDDKAQGDIKYDNLQKSLEGFKRHSQKLQTETVSPEELESAKMLLKQQIHKEFEMPQYQTHLLAMNAQQPYGIKRIDEYYKAIDKISAQDIQNAAKHVFSNKAITSILASADTVANQSSYLRSLEGAPANI